MATFSFFWLISSSLPASTSLGRGQKCEGWKHSSPTVCCCRETIPVKQVVLIVVLANVFCPTLPASSPDAGWQYRKLPILPPPDVRWGKGQASCEVLSWCPLVGLCWDEVDPFLTMVSYLCVLCSPGWCNSPCIRSTRPYSWGAQCPTAEQAPLQLWHIQFAWSPWIQVI